MTRPILSLPPPALPTRLIMDGWWLTGMPDRQAREQASAVILVLPLKKALRP
jgi:hypothetical protein